MNGEQRLQVLRDEWQSCTRCALHETRRGGRIVFGDGPLPADIMIIGSHPTESDEDHGTPFTGDEGDLLVELLKGADIDPESCYRTQIVACRPILIIPQTDDEDERVDTIPPTKEHYEGVYHKEEKKWLRNGCNTRLLTQIYEVDPRIIIALGDVPLKFLKSRDNGGHLPRKMSEAQGDLFEIQIPGVYQNIRYPVMAALPMGYLIKNPVTAAHGPIAIVMEAFRRAQVYVTWIKKRETI